MFICIIPSTSVNNSTIFYLKHLGAALNLTTEAPLRKQTPQHFNGTLHCGLTAMMTNYYPRRVHCPPMPFYFSILLPTPSLRHEPSTSTQPHPARVQRPTETRRGCVTVTESCASGGEGSGTDLRGRRGESGLNAGQSWLYQG
ncbi:hypothetical protein GWI33_016167 [Rhynchophorus ferrugineus]|uniref:Uncharacterized protein n=1 Tax=Rhynchophorus ferrugineus TaxID=354439 RepID=A0A834HYH6_RHYFE|nr:hypothetical protein GWI33_016167 [Rhynchophorus ferrugineus]